MTVTSVVAYSLAEPGLHSVTLDAHPASATIRAALNAALHAADPAQAVRRFVCRSANELMIGERRYDLTALRRVRIIGAGKAGAAMAAACAEILGDALTDGFVVVKDDGAPLPDITKIRFAAAGHPVPDQRGVDAARQLVGFLRDSRADDLVLTLISGGASALLCLPDDTVSLAELQTLTGLLLAAGAPITAMNTVRKHIEQLKGGGLARRAAPAEVVSLILSDVVGSPLDVIASGPTVADGTTYSDALAVLTQYALLERCPATILQVLRAGEAGERPETVKPGDVCLERGYQLTIGSNVLASAALRAAIAAGGYPAVLLTDSLEGEARDVAQVIAALAKQIVAGNGICAAPAALVASGETTVTVRGNGRGGRNQELALAAAIALAGRADITVITLATDGGDGPTDAAGAVVDGMTAVRAAAAGLDLRAALQKNDSYTLLSALGDVLKPGASGTNVNDLVLVLIGLPGTGAGSVDSSHRLG